MPLYQLLLLLFPAAFRAEYGGEMSAVFRARRRDENPLVLWPSTILDVIANAARVHWDMLRQDLAWTFRILGQAPGFTITAVAVAALGIGANTAAFTLLDHVLLRPLPFVHPERLATLYQSDHKNGYSRVELSPLNYRDWKSASKSFEALPAYRGLTVNLSGIGEPERLDGASMSADMLRTLGVHPSLGRGFTASDDQAGAPGTVLLSDSLWRSLFGADPDVVGRRMRLDDQLYTVVGVMPASFSFPNREVELWTPLRLVPPDFQDRTNCFLHVIGRLRPGVTLDQARSELNVITASLEKAYPKDNYGIGATVLDMRDVVSSQSRMLVIAVFGAAFCVMLIACMNLANLLLTRATTRRREIAVRIAIGASRERLVRQLFTENLVLALAGGALGLLLASVAMPSLALLVPDALPIGGAPKVDLRVFCFAGALTIVTTLLFGVGPAARACSQPDMNSLRGRSEAGGRAARLRTALVLAEVVGTVTLLVGAGLLVKALWRIQGVDPGFRPNGVLTMRTVLPMPKYDPTSRRTQFYTHVLTEARALPGVTSAAYVSFLPMVMRGGIWPVGIAGLNDDPATRPKVSLRYATPDFFRTLQIPIIEGRDIGDRDTIDAPFVAVVSQSFGKRYLPGLEPLGRKVNIAFADRTIVGVVADIAVRGLENRSEPQVLSIGAPGAGWLGILVCAEGFGNSYHGESAGTGTPGATYHS